MGSISYRGNSEFVQTTKLEELVDFYESQGKYAEAEKICMRIFELKENLLGPDHQEVGATLHNLALLCYAQDKYEFAESYLLRSLRIEENTLGPRHIEVAATLDVLAQLYYEQGKYAHAVQACKRALDICDQSGSSHAMLNYADAVEYIDMDREVDDDDELSSFRFPYGEELICVFPAAEV